jgi:predicted nuclease of predicted toxin-antitoxin system
MKCKLDENLGDLGRELLEASGHEVSTVAMQGMSGVDDAALFASCCAEERVLLTLDRDFGEILRFPPQKAAGIAVLDCRGRLSPAAILSRLREFIALL